MPQAVCDSCPICQAAATLEQVNPQVLVDLGEVARSVIMGLGSALTSASDQRTFGGGPTDEVDSLDERDGDAPGAPPPTTAPHLSDRAPNPHLQPRAVVPTVAV